jgi:photosystem II stability/assembly factor-like uncharacterized protein
LNNRAARAISLIALAVTAMVVATVAYVHPFGTSAPALRLGAQSPTASDLDPQYRVEYDFVSAKVGWAAVERTNIGNVAYWVFKTNDGAKHWSIQTSGSLDDTSTEIQVRLFDAGHGFFAIGDAAFTTEDGGATWQSVHMPARFEFELTFSDPAHAWFLGTDDVVSIPVQFYATADSGRTWTTLPAPPGRGLAFRTPLEGWAAAATDLGDIAFATHDGGRTWSGHPPPPVTPPGADYSDIAFQDATHWWAMPFGNLFKSADAGQTWTHVSLQLDDWRYHLQVLDARHAWVRLDPPIANPGHPRGSGLAFSSDGGVHWTYAAVPHPPP